MKRKLCLVIMFFGSRGLAPAETIPNSLWGKWVVKRILLTRSISCWDDNEARVLIGTELEYASDVFRWEKNVTKNPVAETTAITDQAFHDENSGQGTLSSQVTFKELGIKEPQALQIVIHHPGASITGGTIEIPGDRVLIKGRDTIVFSACGTYFEASRTKPRGRN